MVKEKCCLEKKCKTAGEEEKKMMMMIQINQNQVQVQNQNQNQKKKVVDLYLNLMLKEVMDVMPLIKRKKSLQEMEVVGQDLQWEKKFAPNFL